MPARPAASTLEATSPARPENEAAASAPPPDVSAADEVLLDAGERAGDFVIEGVLGRGTFGTVYRAAHGVIGRRAAVKVLRDHAADAPKVASFIEEARLVARLRHPNIVDVLTFGQLGDGRHFQVMDLIEGPTLADYLREHGALTLTAALPILRGVASALDAVHRSGVAHRDLKPANVVLERREGELVPKLIDFGIAELIASEAEATPSARGGLVGTPRYMSPEQCRGRPVDARADSYAFGLLAYEMLTGSPPFSGDDALELLLKHTSETPAPPSHLCASLPAAVDPILLTLLEKRPDQRPLELAPVVTQLEAIAAAEDAPIAVDRPTGKWRRTARIGAVGLIVAGSLAAIVRGQRGDRASAAEPATGTAASVVAPPSLGPTASHAEPTSDPTTNPIAGVSAPPETEVGAPPTIPRATGSSPLGPSGVLAPKASRRDAPSASPGAPGLEDSDSPFKKR